MITNSSTKRGMAGCENSAALSWDVAKRNNQSRKNQPRKFCPRFRKNKSHTNFFLVRELNFIGSQKIHNTQIPRDNFKRGVIIVIFASIILQPSNISLNRFPGLTNKRIFKWCCCNTCIFKPSNIASLNRVCTQKAKRYCNNSGYVPPGLVNDGDRVCISSRETAFADSNSTDPLGEPLRFHAWGEKPWTQKID